MRLRELPAPETILVDVSRPRGRARLARPAAFTAGLLFVSLLVPGPATGQTGTPAVEPVPGPDSALRELQSRVEGLERRLGASALFELVTRIDRLTREIRQLRDRIEVQAHSLEGLQERQQDLYSELDRLARRVARPASADSPETPPEDAGGAGATAVVGIALPGTESPGIEGPSDVTNEAAGSGGSSAPMSGGSSPAATEPSRESLAVYDPVEEQARYRWAFDLLSEGRFERAATAFGEFLGAFPESRYRDDAMFWQGECRYALRQFEPALEEFRALVESHPDSSRVPGAKLKIGFILHELGRSAEAAEVLRDLVKTAPESSEAKLASDRLARLE